MKKNYGRTIAAGTLLCSLLLSQAYAGTWNQTGADWTYTKDDGQLSKNEWLGLGQSWYRMQPDGRMLTGWYQDSADGGRWYYLNPGSGDMKTGWLFTDGKWYFLDTRVGGPRGAMLIGWQWIDGKCYYLDPADGGALSVNKTVGGYQVNADGQWISADGTVYYEAGKGIPSAEQTAAGPGAGLSGGQQAVKSGGGPGGSSGGGSSAGGGSFSGGGGGGSASGGHGGSSSGGGSGNVHRPENDGNGTRGEENDPTPNEAGITEEEQEVIDDFLNTYIRDDMNDFEKEIAIIAYMVENIQYTYASKGGTSVYTSYGALVNHEAVCDGYSKGFMTLARACGLTVKRVVGTADGAGGWGAHAWNMIKLDGQWYHVDVTWEDPFSSIKYGFDRLRNKYINLTDAQMKKDHKWNASAYPKCTATRWQGIVIPYYFYSGEADPDISADKWRKFLMKNSDQQFDRPYLQEAGYRLDDGSNDFGDGSDREAIKNYLIATQREGYDATYFVVDGKSTRLDWLTDAYMRSILGGDRWSITWRDWKDGNTFRTVYQIKLKSGTIGEPEDMQKVLDGILAGDRTRLCRTADEAKAFAGQAVLENWSELTIVYPSARELYSAHSMKLDYKELSDAERVKMQTIQAGEQTYTVCTYRLSQKALSEKLSAYLEDGGRNMVSGDAEGLAYIQEILNKREKLYGSFYVIYTDGAAHDQKEEVRAWLSEEGHGGAEFSADSKKEVIDGGKTYHIVRYRYKLLPTLSEAVSGNEALRAYLAEDGSNLFDSDAENAEAALTAYLEKAFEAAEPDENGRLIVYAGIRYTDSGKLSRLENAAYAAVYETYSGDYSQNGIGSTANEAYEGGRITVCRFSMTPKKKKQESMKNPDTQAETATASEARRMPRLQ